MPITEQSIVSFGKYKGESYAKVLEDTNYCIWILTAKTFKGPSRDFISHYFRCIGCNTETYPNVNYSSTNVWCTLCGKVTPFR